MATTLYATGNNLAVKVWAKKLFEEALKQTYFSRFMGEGTDNVVQLKNEVAKGPGDRITVGLRMQLSGAGVQGDGTLEGNEEGLTTFTDNVFIDQLRHAVRSAGKMSEQRVTFEVRDEADGPAGLVG
jgi:N4-gp56 family major capsid protein